MLATAGGADTTETIDLGYAGFWFRFLALFVDGIVISIVTNPITLLIGQGVDVQTVENVRGEVDSFSIDFDWTRLGIAVAVSTILTAAYYIIAISKWGQTLGALAVSVRVQHPDGSLLSPGAAAVRWVGAFVSAIPLYL
ncbi:MAG: RDD family protein, partial [Dehalococcoidia bacterium]